MKADVNERSVILADLRRQRDEIDVAIRVIEGMGPVATKVKPPASFSPRRRQSKGVKMLKKAISEQASADGWISRQACQERLGLCGATLTGYKAKLKLQEGVHYLKNGNGANRDGEMWNLPALRAVLKTMSRRVVKQMQEPEGEVPVPASAILAELNES